MSWLTREQIRGLGFRSVDDTALLSSKAIFYNCAGISIGARSRIDDLCVVSAGPGGIHIGRNVHIAVMCTLMGRERIEMHDFSGLSSRVAIYSSSDDYSGATLTNPTVPDSFAARTHAAVILARHVIIGAGSVILPGVELGEGCAVGAASVIRRSCEPFTMYSGNPARRVGERQRELLEVERRYVANLSDLPPAEAQ